MMTSWFAFHSNAIDDVHVRTISGASRQHPSEIDCSAEVDDQQADMARSQRGGERVRRRRDAVNVASKLFHSIDLRQFHEAVAIDAHV